MPATRYEIKELLGEGGMGVVYRALDTRTNSYVALKTLRDASDPATLEMFKREWAELAKLSHPNIVDVRDVDEIEEHGVRKPCFVMPLLPGVTLAALIKTASPRLTTEFVVSMISQVCKGLQAAHEKDLIHRDLKPSNIFIMNDDTAKIIDFGLVHTVGNKSVTGLKGTWQYMSPEQIEGKQPNRSFDIFSLGVVAYESLTGHQPFKRARFEDTVEAVRHFVPQAISERNPKVPQLLSKAVHVAMAKQPIHRYSSARDFSETLQKAYNNQYLERFDPAKIRPRIDRAKRAFTSGDSEFASEILTELEAEGNLDPDITLLRSQIDEFNKQKRVRQLFEAAQTRLEQDEIPLALEKLEEVLKIDPQHAEALSLRKRIEQQRNQQQVSGWLNLARQHLERHDFGEARRALKEVFNLQYDDPEAARLKAEVDAREKEVSTARNEKEQLYSHALKAHQNGEISSALSKLEKILDLSHGVPGAAVPERDKVFQSFYNDVRTERDRIDNAYADGTRSLSEKNFDKALGICDGILFRYPRNAQFQALRLKVEHAQRQELSAYIAEVGRAVDSEPNLDRRVGLLEEACKRYPNETQFPRQLSLAKELRDLVDSIVARARSYEEQGQFAEAITQWNTLANIHPHYPGIDFEINQLERRREQQSEADKKARLVERIDRALDSSDYADAERLSQDGLREFPQNPELLALLRLARQGLERTREATSLFEQAKQQRKAGESDQAIVLLRQALDLDKRNIVIQNTLVNLLVERAHALLDTNWAAAEPLAAEAAQLDPDHPSVGKIISLIAQAKKQDYVELCVGKARDLQSQDVKQAIDVLRNGLERYPNELRLQQTLTSLQREDTRATVGASAIGYAPPEKETLVYPLEYAVPPVVPPPPSKTQVALPPSQAPQPVKKQDGPSQQAAQIQPLFQRIAHKLFGGDSRNANLMGAIIGLVASGILIGLVYLYQHKKPPVPQPVVPLQQPVEQVEVFVDPTPGDATISLNGAAITDRQFKIEKGKSFRLSISRPGYKTAENTLVAAAKTFPFALEPEPLHVSVVTSQSSGAVLLDNNRAGDLKDGEWSEIYPLKSAEEQHVLSVKDKGKEVFKIQFGMVAGKAATVSSVHGDGVIVVSSLGKEATLYSAGKATVNLADKGRQNIPAGGLPVNLDDAPNGFPIKADKQSTTLQVAESNAPSLSISLNAAPNLATVTVSSPQKNATLFVDGEKVKQKRAGQWSWTLQPGTYKGKLVATGMRDEEFPITVRKGENAKLNITLKSQGPPPASLAVSGGTPRSTVSVDGSPVGELDDQGNLTYSGINPGYHDIEISKAGFHSFSSRQNFTEGHTLNLPGVRKLAPEFGFATFSVSPANAKVHFHRSGESERHLITDFSGSLSLKPGQYEFTADADGYVPAVETITIEADKTARVTLSLAAVKTADEQSYFADAKAATKVPDSNWYTGKTKDFILLRTGFAKNTIIFSKAAKAKHMVWRVFLDDDNNITYNFDGKDLVIGRRIDGEKLKDAHIKADLTQSENYAALVQVSSHTVRISAKRDGIAIDTTSDDKHDWSHAQLSVRGDAVFVVFPGR